MIVERKHLSFDCELPMQFGGKLERFTLAYEMYGELNSDRSNAILLFHSLSSDAHAAGRHSPDDPKPGWWDKAIGPGKLLDTERFCVICSAAIGGCGGSTGPSCMNEVTDRPWGMSFPMVTIGDMVEAQKLLVERLGISSLFALVGGCMGGFLAQEWMIRFPDMFERTILMATSMKASAYTIARNEVARQAIYADPDWNEGNYYEGAYPANGIAHSMLIGLLTWMTPEAMLQKYGRKRRVGDTPSYSFDPEFEIEFMIEKVKKSVSGKFDPNSLLYLTRTMDYFDCEKDLTRLCKTHSLEGKSCLVVSYKSDKRYPPSSGEKIARIIDGGGCRTEFVSLDNAFGHGAYLYHVDQLEPYVSRALDQE